jgi:sec-independent protein translocase protein TatA
MSLPLAFGGLTTPQILLLLGLGVLLFGRRLPELGKSLGKSIVEFKKGLKGMEDELDPNAAPRHDAAPQSDAIRPPQRVSSPTGPRFDNVTPKFEDTNSTPTPPKI